MVRLPSELSERPFHKALDHGQCSAFGHRGLENIASERVVRLGYGRLQEKEMQIHQYFLFLVNFKVG